MEQKDSMNLGLDEQGDSGDVTKMSDQDLEKALQETEDLDTIKKIIGEIEKRTDKKGDRAKPESIVRKAETVQIEEHTEDRNASAHLLHIIGSVFFFIMGYLFLIISGVSLLMYWISPYLSGIRLEVVTIRAVIGIICLGLGHIVSLLVSISKGIQKFQ